MPEDTKRPLVRPRVPAGPGQQGQKSIVPPIPNQHNPQARHTGFVPVPLEEHPKVQEALRQQQAGAGGNGPTDPPFVNDGRYTLLTGLPSNYFEYSFNEMWIRPFTPNEARLLHMARTSGNLTYVISAVAACLSVPVGRLLIEDFEFCMYWLRMQSYPAKPFNITWTCKEDVIKVTDNDERPDVEEICNFENLTTVGKTNLIVDSFVQRIVLPEGMAFPTMSSYEELWSIRQRLKVLEKQGRLESEEYDDIVGDIYLMSIAQWIKDGETMTDKLDILKAAPSMELQDSIEAAVTKIPEFGVSEDLSVVCAKCGRTSRRRLSLDYLTFFP